MEKIKGWNRNLIGGKRPHRGIQRYGHLTTLTQRLLAESKALEDYQRRVGQSSNWKNY
jgi:hypothetical protein